MFKLFSSGKTRNWLMLAVAVACVIGFQSLAMAAGETAPAKSSSMGTLIFHILDWMVILILIGSSIAGVALSIDSIMHIRQSKIVPEATTEHLRSLINSRQFKDLMDFTATDQSFVSQALNAGLRRAHLGYPAMREGLETSAGEQMANYFRRIEFLNVIGNIGPLIGLLGTVLGMIISFYELGASGGNAKPADLAVGISTALWHTFGGLAVAIPCLVVFGLYRTKVDKITTGAAILAEELLESLRPADGKSGIGGGEAAAKPAPRRAAAPSPAPVAEGAAE